MEPNYNKPKWQNIKIGGPVIFVALIVAALIGLNIYKNSQEYQKPENWVISQSLHSILTKQQLLLNQSKGGISLGDLAKVASTSTTIKPEAVKIGSNYLLATGFDGKVEFDIDPGKYLVEIVKIQGLDFTGIPDTINIERGNYLLEIGVVEGSGKIQVSTSDLVGQQAPDLRGRLKVSLFSDKNNDGKKGPDEADLPWAGVTLRLTRQSP